MRRSVLGLSIVTTIVLAVPGVARAGLLDDYQELAERRLDPAPLVPTVAPPSLQPLDRTITLGQSRRRSGYGLRLVHYAPDGPDAIVALEGGSFKSVRAALRDGRRLGFRARRTRVRGRRGHLLTRRLGPRQWSLVWAERGVVYTIGTGTPKKVSLQELRATAAGLDRLEGAYGGSGGDPDLGDGALVVLTTRTASVYLEWAARCFTADGTEVAAHGGGLGVPLVQRSGATFGFDIDTEPWSGAAQGTVGPDVVDFAFQASANVAGATCDTGPVSFALDPVRPLP